MKRITFRLSIAALTFTVGVAGPWLMGKKQKAREALSEVSTEVSTAVAATGKPRFTATFRACGMGYVQGYELPDGRAMAEGTAGYSSRRKAKRELEKYLAKASTIVERVPNYKNRFGEVGERIVALFPPDEEGKAGASIIWYGGGRFFHYIDAPSLEIALEFESWDALAH